MIPVVQDNRGDVGNCMAACLASIVERSIDDVPDYRAIERAGGSWMNAFNTWLTKHYNVLYVELEEYLTPHVTPQGYHLINLGDAEGGHSIVGHSGDAIWDPVGRFLSHRKPVTPFNYGILVRVDTRLRATWAPTWSQCLCPPCIRGES